MAHKVIRETQTIEVRHGNWNGPRGSWQETAPTEHITVTLEIDVQALMDDVGRAAARNKTGVAREAGGAITAKRSKR